MKREVKRRFQEMILKIVGELPLYPSPYESDTTWIAQHVAKEYRRELVEMGIIDYLWDGHYRPEWVDEGWEIQEKVLRQLNNLHKEGKVDKVMDYGGEGMGRNYTFIRWGKHTRFYVHSKNGNGGDA